MSDTGNSKSGGLNHGPGTFTHNNASSLPNQDSGQSETSKGQFDNTRDDITKAEHAAAQLTEAERRNQMQRPVMTYESFKAERSYHQPAPELSYETPLPYRASVDAAKFNDQQIKTHRQAMKDQPVHVPQSKQAESERNLKPSEKQKFISGYFAKAQNPKPSKGRNQ